MNHERLGNTPLRATVLAILLLLSKSPSGLAGDRPHVVFSRIGPARSGLFIAEKDGQNERPLLPATGLDYNASFSADGKWIVFTSERGGSADIYRVHPDGSGVEELTEGPSYDDQGSLSPDGRTLAFVSSRNGGTANIWLLDLRSRVYTNLTGNTAGNFRPSWSPDGQWIAFSSDRDTKPGRATPSWEMMQSTAIYIVRRDGSELRRLTALGGYFGSPQWSADGRRIVCYQSTPRDLFPKSNEGPRAQIVSIDVATGEIETQTTGPGLKVSPRYTDNGDTAYVLHSGTNQGVKFLSGRKGASGALRCPCWSPDGKLMVYQKSLPAEIAVAPAFSLDPRFDLFSTTSWMVSYSPNGDQLAASGFGENLVIMNDDGSHLHTIFESTNEVLAFPSWSPDGTRIVFGIGGFFARPVRPGQLAVIRPDGSGFRMLTHGKASSGFASWSPDGKQLVFRVMGDGEQGLRILTLDTGKITELTTDYDTFPAWSPAGDKIAFCSFRRGDYDIYTMRLDGSEVRKLTDSHGNDAHPIWSPDGRWIVFSSSRMGFKDEAMLKDQGPQPYGKLFVMRADGTEVSQLTDNQWEDATPAWRPGPLTR